jgi:outer membrane protein, heavy metal efflux system
VDAARGATDEKLALERRPEPKRFQLAAQQAGIEYDFAKNQQKLGLDLVVAGSKDLGRGAPTLLRPELEVMVLVDVPLLNRVNDGRAQSADAARARASQQARFAKDRVVADVRDAASAMDLARRRFVAARSEVQVAKSLVELEQQRFDLGDGTLLIVNLREQSLGEAELREVDAVADFHKATASRTAAVGGAQR